MIGVCSLEPKRIKSVITFPFIHDGIPILYYGMPGVSSRLVWRSLKHFQVRSKVTLAVVTPLIAKRKPNSHV